MRKGFHWRDGSRAFFEEEGQGPILICLHGLGGGGYFFSDLAQALRSEYRTIAFDMPGLGQNASLVDRFSIEDCVTFLIDLVDEQCDDPICLLGHSMGTIIALKAYAERSKRFAGMIFLGGLPQPVSAIQEKLADRNEILATKRLSDISREAMTGIFSKRTRAEKQHLVAMYRQMFEQNDLDRYRQSINALINASAEEVVGSLELPCLAVTGAEDLYASPEDVELFMKRISSPSEMQVFEESGHMVFFEEPERLEASVRRFLAGIFASSARPTIKEE